MEHVDGRLLKLAVYYLYNCDGVTGICNNTDRPTIAKVTGISQGQIWRYNKRLREMGYITLADYFVGGRGRHVRGTR